MAQRKIFTYEQGINPPGFDRIPGSLGLIPTIMIDDATGQITSAGVPIGAPPPDETRDICVEVVPISSAQLLNLKATPIVVVDAPGPSFAVLPISASIQYLPVSVDYTLGDATNLFIGGAVNPLTLNTIHPIPATILNGSSGPGNVLGVAAGTNAVVANQSWFDNQPIVITHNGSAELTSGDGTIVVKVYYAVVSL